MMTYNKFHLTSFSSSSLIKIMAEGVAPAELAQAARAGQPFGEPASAAHKVSMEIMAEGREEYGSALGVRQATEQIEGVKEAHPGIVGLAIKIVGGLGSRLEEQGTKMQERSKRRAEAAIRHVDEALKAREQLLKIEEGIREGKIAQTLVESVPPWLAQRLIALRGRGEGIVEGVKRMVKERYHGFFAGLNAKRAEVDSLLGKYYYDAGTSLEKVATEIVSKWGEEKGRRLEQLGQKRKEEGDRLEQIRERIKALNEQFEQITGEGPALARGATIEVEATKPADVTGQQAVVERLAQQIGSMKGGNP